MGMIVQHNMNALNAYNALNANVSGMKKSSEKLSSGYRINRAGDDAAGLAISEKMRSQIRGLNQAVRNSQDGINMVQTFEGAAQETHSILQRMKELATESANGTYDNATDRAAIQLEFDQLNDELNQIADTDFNGTIVLNGGVMADGTVARNGEFNYAEGWTETTVAQKATDISGEQAHELADQTYYNKAVADAVWDAVGVDVADHQKMNVTFMFDGERWVADTVTDENGNVIEGARAAGLTVDPMELNGNSGNGGFKVIAGKNAMTGEDIVATNAIFDEMTPVKKGDTVTLEFTNTAKTTYAPKNAGIGEDYTVTPDDGAAASGTSTLKKASFVANDSLKFELDSSITDANMTDAMKTALDDLVASEFSYTFDGNDVDLSTLTGNNITVDADGVVTHDNGTVLGTITLKAPQIVTAPTAGSAASATSSNAALTVNINDADKVTDAVYVYDNGTTWTGWSADGGVSTMNAAGWAAVGLDAPTGTPAAGDKITTVATKAPTAGGTANDPDATGELKFKVNVDAFNFANTDNLSVHSVATPKAATMASQVAESGVTVANAFNNSTARMTYTDNITLQTGARTKDAVNFNFSYNTDGTADMGNLVANLDLSARSTGLNTANLSLANADDANYAIDQIDKAINKTSMVRATFGSIQNRLEHKITNLTTTAENLTEAESSIRDTDMASEMMNYTKYNILQQAAQSMLAQANQQPQSILQLLG